mmetsp:Transcript_108667/g.232150  ORF Transcript_108667/g.232150 Transcript_108667/m.232150 type:complete len:395 (+) Transcript_108667:72-1256(+)
MDSAEELPRILRMLSVINSLSHDPDAADLVQSGVQLAAAVEPLVQVQHVARRLLMQQAPDNHPALNAVMGTFQLLPLLLQAGGPPCSQRPLDERALSRLPEIHITADKLERLRNSGGGEAMCAICHEDYADGQKLLQLPCEHCFCVDCGRQWLRRCNTCPVCRTEVPDADEGGGWHSEDTFPFRFPQGSPLSVVRRVREAQDTGSLELWPPVDDMSRIAEQYSVSPGAEEDHPPREFPHIVEALAEGPTLEQRHRHVPSVSQESHPTSGTGHGSRSTSRAGTDVSPLIDQHELPVRGASRTAREETQSARISAPRRRQYASDASRALSGVHERVRQGGPLPPLSQARGALDPSSRAPSRTARDDTGAAATRGAGVAASQGRQTRDVRRSSRMSS